jgi:hypothetical protein
LLGLQQIEEILVLHYGGGKLLFDGGFSPRIHVAAAH